MAHGQRAAMLHSKRKELGGRYGYGWMSRNRYSKKLTIRRRRRFGKDEIRKELER